MKQYKLVLIALFGLTLMVSGCMKKSSDQASLQGTGFETATTEDLAQLPQANSTTANQQAGIEVLPIETSPVTQGVPAPGLVPTSTQTTVTTTSGTLNRSEQIQTALKNAGFYSGKIDGKIGPGSKKAIEAFQESKGLKADGKVGPKTWSALEPYLTSGTDSSAASVSTTTTTTD